MCCSINEIWRFIIPDLEKQEKVHLQWLPLFEKRRKIEVNVHWPNVCMRMSERRSIAMMFGTMALTARMWLLRLPRRLHSAPRFLDLNCVAAIGP